MEKKEVKPFGELTTYFVTYKYLGQKNHCQILANSESECRQIFDFKFKYCHLEAIKTAEDIGNELSEGLIEEIARQFKIARA